MCRAAPQCPVLCHTRVPTAAGVCPRSLPPAWDPSVSAALSLVFLGVWTVFCSAAILGSFIVQHVSLTRKKIPAVLEPGGIQGHCGNSSVTSWLPGMLWELCTQSCQLQSRAGHGAFLQEIHLEAFPLKKIKIK